MFSGVPQLQLWSAIPSRKRKQLLEMIRAEA